MDPTNKEILRLLQELIDITDRKLGTRYDRMIQTIDSCLTTGGTAPSSSTSAGSDVCGVADVPTPASPNPVGEVPTPASSDSDAKLVTIDIDGPAAPAWTTRSTGDTTKSRSAPAPTTAPTVHMATVDIVPVLAAPAATDGTLDGQAISGVPSTPATCSMGCLPRHPVAAAVLVTSSILAPAKCVLDTNTTIVAAVPLATMGEFPVVLAPTAFTPMSQMQQLYNGSKIFMPTSGQLIASKVPRPMPWPSFMGVHADEVESRPWPWPSFEKIGCEFPSNSVEKAFWLCISDSSHAKIPYHYFCSCQPRKSPILNSMRRSVSTYDQFSCANQDASYWPGYIVTGSQVNLVLTAASGSHWYVSCVCAPATSSSISFICDEWIMSPWDPGRAVVYVCGVIVYLPDTDRISGVKYSPNNAVIPCFYCGPLSIEKTRLYDAGCTIPSSDKLQKPYWDLSTGALTMMVCLYAECKNLLDRLRSPTNAGKQWHFQHVHLDRFHLSWFTFHTLGSLEALLDLVGICISTTDYTSQHLVHQAVFGFHLKVNVSTLNWFLSDLDHSYLYFSSKWHGTHNLSLLLLVHWPIGAFFLACPSEQEKKISSSSDSTSCGSNKLELNSSVSYMVQQYTYLSYFGIQVGFHSFGKSTTRAIRDIFLKKLMLHSIYFDHTLLIPHKPQPAAQAADCSMLLLICLLEKTVGTGFAYSAISRGALLLLIRSAALKCMDLWWFATVIFTGNMGIFSMHMDVTYSVQPNIMPTHAYQHSNFGWEQLVRMAQCLSVGVKFRGVHLEQVSEPSVVFSQNTAPIQIGWPPRAQVSFLTIEGGMLWLLVDMRIPSSPTSTGNLSDAEQWDNALDCLFNAIKGSQISWNPGMSQWDVFVSALICRQSSLQERRRMTSLCRHMVLRFPWDPGVAAAAWGQAAFQGGRGVRDPSSTSSWAGRWAVDMGFTVHQQPATSEPNYKYSRHSNRKGIQMDHEPAASSSPTSGSLSPFLYLLVPESQSPLLLHLYL